MIVKFVEENLSLYNAAIMDLKEIPRNSGKVTASKYTSISSCGQFIKYDIIINGVRTTYNTFDEMKEDLSKLGYIYEGSDLTGYKFINKSIAEEYEKIRKSTEEFNQSILNARRQIKANAKAFLFETYSKTFVRFGAVPQSGKSYNYRDRFFENGVSVYEAVQVDDKYYIDVCGSIFTFGGLKKNKEAYEITGVVLNDRGSDGEPLLSDVIIINKIKNEFVGTVDDFIYDVFNQEI